MVSTIQHFLVLDILIMCWMEDGLRLAVLSPALLGLAAE